MHVRALSLDAYGTLFEGGSDAFVALVRGLAADAGADADALLARREAIIRGISESRFVGMRARDREVLTDLFGRLGLARDVEATLDELARAYRAVRVYPDARRLLAGLRVPWGVASNTDEDVMRALLREHGLDPAFVVTSETVRAYKPNAAVFAAVARAAAVPPASILHVGDSWTADVEGAKAAGMRAAWIRRPGGLPPPAARGHAPDLVVDDLADLLPALG